MEYFHIIKHKASGKFYAGSRWKKGCNPSELLTEDGYHTSARSIQKLIKSENLDAFSVELVIPQSNISIHVYDYETAFLQHNDCAKNPLWFNKHNNNRPPPYGTQAYRDMMIEKYGVEHNGQIPGMRKQMTNKMMETLAANPDIAKARMTDEVRKRISESTKKPKTESHRANMKDRCGKWKRGPEDIARLAAGVTKRNLTNNPMSSEESRAKVGASKVGRKRIYREDGSFFYTPQVN